MAAARPVAAFGSGGTVEMVRSGETGLLVPPGDVEALGRAFARLVERGRIGERAGERAYFGGGAPDLLVAGAASTQRIEKLAQRRGELALGGPGAARLFDRRRSIHPRLLHRIRI